MLHCSVAKVATAYSICKSLLFKIALNRLSVDHGVNENMSFLSALCLSKLCFSSVVPCDVHQRSKLR